MDGIQPRPSSAIRSAPNGVFCRSRTATIMYALSHEGILHLCVLEAGPTPRFYVLAAKVQMHQTRTKKRSEYLGNLRSARMKAIWCVVPYFFLTRIHVSLLFRKSPQREDVQSLASLVSTTEPSTGGYCLQFFSTLYPWL